MRCRGSRFICSTSPPAPLPASMPGRSPMSWRPRARRPRSSGPRTGATSCGCARGLPPRLARRSEALTLASSRPGGFDALGWEAAAPRAPGPGEVEIDVHAAGLNFRDVMWAMGLLPEEALIDGFAGAGFGLECAGIVRAVGPGVEGLAVGDRVMALAPAALGTRVVTPAAAVVPIPAETSFAAAATIPVAFVTAIYALGHLAQLAKGEHVLIHAAAGGVGLAAIQYAKHRGAIVIATAGSEVKRAFLRLAGADHVLDSRDLGLCRRGARNHPRAGGRRRAELAERRGDGAQPRSAEAVRALSRARQARLLPQSPPASAPAAPEPLVFRDRCRPAAAAPPGSRPIAAGRDLGGACRGRDPAAGAPRCSASPRSRTRFA